MHFNSFATRGSLLACALLVLASCTTDDPDVPPLGPSVTPSLAVSGTSAYDIVKVSNSAVTVDGNLSDWASVAAIPTFSDDPNNGRGSANNGASVKLAWDDSYLYAAYNVTDTELLAVQTTRDHADLYKDDEVELYIDPQGDGGTATSMTPTDYQFLANIREALGDKKGTGTQAKDASYNAASFVAKVAANGTVNASGTDTGYSLEMRISWSDLDITPAAGNFMRIDLAVGDRDGATPSLQYFDWANLGDNFNNPSGWKEVQLVSSPPSTSAYDLVKAAAMNVDGFLSDWTGVDSIMIADDPGNGRGVLNNSAKVKLVWNDTYLFTMFDVSDTDLLAIQTARDAASLYQDDEVELYIDPQGDGATASSMTATDYHFLANLLEVVGDKRGTGTSSQDASYNAAGFLAKAVTYGTVNASGADTRYVIETRIPWSDLGVIPGAGNSMRIDLAVGDRDGAAPTDQYFDWANLGNNFNRPSGWNPVRLVVDATVPAAPTNPTLNVVSSSAIDVSWTASTDSDVSRYRIYRGTTGTPTLVATVYKWPYHDTGLTPGTSYTYQIAAVDVGGNESAKTSPTSTTTHSGATGIPFGLWDINLDTLSPGLWTGAAKNSNDHDDLMRQLRLADSLGVKIWVGMAGSYSGYRNADGSFNFTEWKKRLDRGKADGTTSGHAGDTLSNGTSGYYDEYLEFIQNGTFQGIVLLDDLKSEFEPDITFSQVEAMAAYSKRRFPALLTTVRERASQLKNLAGANAYQSLDVAWSQIRYDRTPASSFRDTEIEAAKDKQLGLVFGINITHGGNSARDPVTQAQLSDWASQLLKPGEAYSDYACGLIMWKADTNTKNYSWSSLVDLAADHVAAPCKRR